MGGAFCHRRSCAALIAASMTRRVFMAEKRTANACCSTRGTCDTRLLFDQIDVDVDALADLAAVTGAGSEQLARVLGGLRFDAPLLHAGDVHRGMEGLEHGPLFESGNSHGFAPDESLHAAESSRTCRREQIGNANLPSRQAPPWRRRNRIAFALVDLVAIGAAPWPPA